MIYNEKVTCALMAMGPGGYSVGVSVDLLARPRSHWSSYWSWYDPTWAPTPEVLRYIVTFGSFTKRLAPYNRIQSDSQTCCIMMSTSQGSFAHTLLPLGPKRAVLPVMVTR